MGLTLRIFASCQSEVLAYKKELQILIRNLDILEYSDFMDYLQDNDLFTLYDIASSNTYF